MTPNCACNDGGATLGQYTYDPFGRRLSKTVNGVTTWFHYDDTGLLAEYSASGQLLNEYQYRPGSTWMTNPLFKRDGATGKVHYYYNSHLGQPLKLFDKAGKITWAARSQAFGQTTVFVNETENNLRFPGQYEDAESGLFYNHHRYYDPQVSRYVRADPLGLSAGLNVYTYASDNPLTRVDPDGRNWAGILALGALNGAINATVNSRMVDAGCISFGGLFTAGAVGGIVGGMSRNPYFGSAMAGGITGGLNAAFSGGGTREITTAGISGAVGGLVGAMLGAGAVSHLGDAHKHAATQAIEDAVSRIAGEIGAGAAISSMNDSGVVDCGCKN